MSIEVALQSVAFYVLSCTTCAKINHRRKAKIRAKKERAEKHALETEQPGLYRHPSPFSTNPYWDEEITMGPGPPKKKAEKNSSQAALNPAGPESSYANSYTMSSTTGTASSPTAIEESRTSEEGWNRKRYQREDEALWGHDTPGPGQRIFDAIARAGSTAGRLLEGRLNKGTGSDDENNPRSYYLAKNPPVNDLHPPVVSTQPASRDETRWMLQPPPPAKVMEGKERVRTRAVSAGSSRKGLDGSPLSRPVTDKLDEVKEQRIETVKSSEAEITPQPQDSGSKAPSPSNLRGQPHERSTRWTADASGSDESLAKAKQNPLGILTFAAASSLVADHTPVSFAPTAADARGRPKPKEIKGPKALRELSPVSSNSTMNSRATSSNRLSPNANSMPVTIPSVESKFPGIPTSVFPKPTPVENSGPAGLDIEATQATQPSGGR
jgi:hypothetical protein